MLPPEKYCVRDAESGTVALGSEMPAFVEKTSGKVVQLLIICSSVRGTGSERGNRQRTHPYVFPSGGSNTNAPRLNPQSLAKTDSPRSFIEDTVSSLRTSRSSSHVTGMSLSIKFPGGVNV